jgi:hypothetical protein
MVSGGKILDDERRRAAIDSVDADDAAGWFGDDRQGGGDRGR